MSSHETDPLARPGHPDACVAGCICPRLDNGHGSTALARDRGGWIIASDCPLHGIGGSRRAIIPPQPGSKPILSEVDGV